MHNSRCGSAPALQHSIAGLEKRIDVTEYFAGIGSTTCHTTSTAAAAAAGMLCIARLAGSSRWTSSPS
jgi:hypothetical protein